MCTNHTATQSPSDLGHVYKGRAVLLFCFKDTASDLELKKSPDVLGPSSLIENYTKRKQRNKNVLFKKMSLATYIVSSSIIELNYLIYFEEMVLWFESVKEYLLQTCPPSRDEEDSSRRDSERLEAPQS